MKIIILSVITLAIMVLLAGVIAEQILKVINKIK